MKVRVETLRPADVTHTPRHIIWVRGTPRLKSTNKYHQRHTVTGVTMIPVITGTY